MDLTALNRLIAESGCFSGSGIAGWTTDPAVMAPLLLGGLLYAVGVVRLWRAAGTGHGASFTQVGCFAGGWPCWSEYGCVNCHNVPGMNTPTSNVGPDCCEENSSRSCT